MTCGPEPVTFRILDTHAVWTLDLHPASNAVTVGDVIELAQLDPAAVDPAKLAGVMPPPWIAHGCAPCDWYLACKPAVLRYAPRIVECKEPDPDPCAPPAAADPSCLGWVPIAGAGCHIELIDPASVAATRDHVAVLDAGRREVLVLTPGGEHVLRSFPTRARGPIAFWRTTIVVADRDELIAFDLATGDSRVLAKAEGPITRMVAAGSTLWIVVAAPGTVHLFYLHGNDLVRGALADLIATARPTLLASATDDVACLLIPRGGSEPRTLCIDRCGRPATPPPATSGPARYREGIVQTFDPRGDTPIDSGVPRCHWHRVRLDLDLPPRTGVTISLATVEDPGLPIAPEDWQHVDDQDAIRDFLIDQPPGRYLHVKIQLRGDGIATPAIQRLRIDFPRSTSATRLPGVFRDDPIAADFLDRFVSLFDASIEDLDRVIATFPALLDPAGTPPEALAWIGTFLDIALDPAWSIETRRDILREAPELYRRRGTPWALSRAIELTTGRAPAIQELASSGMFARVGKPGADRGFRIGEARLFGAARARMRLGASALGQAPLRSYGDPDRDHLAATGWRILVQLPGGGARNAPDALDRLRRLVDTQKPAHVTAQIRIGGDLALVGTAMAVGIDTRLGGLPLPYLGRNTQLGRRTVLARGRARGGVRMAVGTAAAVAIQTVLS